MNECIRPPRAEEGDRAAHLFRAVSLPPRCNILVAVRSRPVERFVAAAAWWLEDTIARFRLVCQPGVPRLEVAGALVMQVEQAARIAGAMAVSYVDLLGDESEWRVALKGQGFGQLRSERFFEIPAQLARERVTKSFLKYRADIPSTWRTASIRHHSPETVFDLVQAHRLLPPAELRNCWLPGHPLGFDLDLSCILFDGTRAFGTLLARRVGDTLGYEVRIVQEANPRLRALGNLCLFQHDMEQEDPGRTICRLRFRGGETEHRETANLAFRMGGRELPIRHVFAKTLIQSS